MKPHNMKLIFPTTLLLLFSLSMSAQSPVIQELRKVMTARDTQFKSLKKEMVSESAKDGVKLFSSIIADSPISKAVILETNTEGAIYLINFDITAMDDLKLQMFMTIVQQYMDEINAMVKSGNFSGREFVDDGSNVTELTDADGKVAAQYISNASTHMVMVFGK